MADIEAVGMRPGDLATLFRLTDGLYRATTYPEIYDAALDAITTSLGSRASILLFDDKGVMRFVAWRGLSDGYRAALEGHSPWTPADVSPNPISVEDIAESSEPAHVRERILSEGIRGLAFIPIVSRRRVIGKFMTYYPDPHRFSGADMDFALTIARQLGFSIERKRAEEELRESEERFRLLSEDAPVMLWMSDQNGRCLHLNHMLRRFWGVDNDALDSFDWSSTMHPDDRGFIQARMGEAIVARQGVVVDGRYRNAEGAYRLLSTNARPRFSPAGAFLGMIGVNVDVTAQREAEDGLRMLLAELNHRVKNTLAVVQAIAHQTFQGGRASPEALRSYEGRLVALSSAHDLLTRSNWESASLRDIALNTVHAQGIEPARYALEGVDIDLPPKQALALSLALHELSTNAIKYGALSNQTGRIDLRWTRDGDRLAIRWTEAGGPPVSAPERRGFGSRLIEKALARDLDADIGLDFDPAGVRCSIEARLPSARDAAP